jgi:hypothetical protein
VDAYSAKMAGGAARELDAPALWAGVMATAVVAGLIAILGVVAAHVVFGTNVVRPDGERSFADATVSGLALSAVVLALIGGVLVHVLAYLTGRALLFFGCIVTLETALLALWPFTTNAASLPKLATSMVHLAIGTAVVCLTTTSTRHAMRRR